MLMRPERTTIIVKLEKKKKKKSTEPSNHDDARELLIYSDIEFSVFSFLRCVCLIEV